jgi:alpha-N-acetylglucosaminidase
LKKAENAVDDTHTLEEMQKVFLFAAKNQITLWGPNAEINDYSAREWSGLVGDYYYGRWNLYFDMLFDALNHNITLDQELYHNRSIEYGLRWDQDVIF